MATIFFVKDGSRTLGNRTNEGINKSIADTVSLLNVNARSCHFLGGEPPEFNPSQPGDCYSHVVVEVALEDKVNDAFPKVGFYVVNMNVSQAVELLN
jgi:hypothetical protein